MFTGACRAAGRIKFTVATVFTKPWSVEIRAAEPLRRS